MKLIAFLLRLFALAFNLAVALFLLGIGLVGWLHGQDVRFDLVPGVEPENMAVALMGLGAFALFAIVVSRLRSKVARLLMVLWNLLVSSLLVCAFARPSYRFDGMEHLQQGAILFVISLFALLGSWLVLRKKPSAAKS